MVRQIVESYNGTIAVDSKEGHGTIFTVQPPLANRVEQSDKLEKGRTQSILQAAGSLHHMG